MKIDYIFTNAYCPLDFEKDISQQLLEYSKNYSLFHAVVRIQTQTSIKQQRVEFVKKIKELKVEIERSGLIRMNEKYNIDSISRTQKSGVVIAVEINEDYQLAFYQKLFDIGVRAFVLNYKVDKEILEFLQENKVVIQSFKQSLEYDGYLAFEYQLDEDDDLIEFEKGIQRALDEYGIEKVYLSGRVFSFDLLVDVFEQMGIVNGERKKVIGKNLLLVYKKLWE